MNDTAKSIEELYVVRGPVRWERDEGNVVLFVPRKRSMERLLAFMLGTPSHVRLRLDAEGSRAWNLCDGSRTLTTIARQMERPLAGVTAFVAPLARHGALRLAQVPVAPEDEKLGPQDIASVPCARCAREIRFLASPPIRRVKCVACGKTMRVRAASS